MKAAQISEYGHADAVKVVDIDKPVARDRQVLVEVHASSINPFDTLVREGHLKDMIPLKLPVTLGGDIAGVVAELGRGVEGFAVGDTVYGQANAVAGNSGAFAEFAVTAAGQLGKMPQSIGFNDAAAVVLVGLSSQQALVEHLNLQPGQKILIHGGSGGIGSVAIQIAKHIGAHVATTATGDGLDFVKGLGADEIIDYKSQDFTEMLDDYDAVFDTVGGETYTKSFEVMKGGGIIVSMTTQPSTELMVKYGVTALYQQTHTTTEALEKLAKLIDDGVVTVHVDKIFPLADIQQAFEARESGQVKGKVAISIKE
jgi:alcohol dehydrogenase